MTRTSSTLRRRTTAAATLVTLVTTTMLVAAGCGGVEPTDPAALEVGPYQVIENPDRLRDDLVDRRQVGHADQAQASAQQGADRWPDDDQLPPQEAGWVKKDEQRGTRDGEMIEGKLALEPMARTEKLAGAPLEELVQPPVMRKEHLRPYRLKIDELKHKQDPFTRCPPGLTPCNGSCVNVLFDPLNCGTCGRNCATPQCYFARCVPYQGE